MTGPKVVGSIPPDSGNSATTSTETPASGASTTEQRLSHALPTDRVSFAKQFEILRGYAALASQGTGAPTNPAVANLVQLNRSTTLLVHPFFTDVGLLTKSGDGYAPVAEVLSYGKAYAWNTDTAAERLHPVFRRCWAAQALVPHATMNPVDETRAIQILGEACNATPGKHDNQIKSLLAYLVSTNVLRRDGDFYRASAANDAEVEMGAVRAEQVATPSTSQPAKDTAPRTPGIATAFAQVPEGVLRFSVDVNVDLREFASWKPDRISAFWAGIAQVLAAKAAVEQGSNV